VNERKPPGCISFLKRFSRLAHYFKREDFLMAHQRSVGPLFSLAGGQTVSWSISYGTGQDVGIVTAAPNIIDDVLGVVLLQAQNQGLGATSDSRNFYTVDIHNPGTQHVAHNLNLQDWL
jgi:hypothetical protein